MSTEDPLQRNSAGSGRSSSGRTRQNPQQQLSTIEKSVTHLLVATKQLLETLTHWSRRNATESEVSDVYVRLGYEFNIACRAFNSIGVDTTDLGPVPDLLREILEDTLSQEASQASLDRYLPRIRDIIINLLHGLKKKQQRLRQRNTTNQPQAEGSTGGDVDAARPARQTSTASSISMESNLTQQLEDLPSRQSSSRSFANRQASVELPAQPDLPPRTTSVAGTSSPRRTNLSPQNSVHRPNRDANSDAGSSASSLSSNAMQNIPVIAPYPETDTIPTNAGYEPEQASPEPPRPPPKQNDALTALQRGGDLERRASRRFSAYQIQKHLGTNMNGIAAIPPAQHSPVPNRGRDVRESMNAVRSRGSTIHSRARSRHDKSATPGFESNLNKTHDVRRISEETSDVSAFQAEAAPAVPQDKLQAEEQQLDSPIVKTLEDKRREYTYPQKQDEVGSLGATLNGPIDEPFAPDGAFTGVGPPSPEEPKQREPPARDAARTTPGRNYDTPPSSQYVPESSPQPGKELTLFLQYKSKIKKFVLPDGADLSIPRLQLAFIEKFAWNTQNNGVDLPEIYIQDPVSGVRHELEDLSDIKERSVLALNVEALDEVKRHIDDGIGSLRHIVEGIKNSVEDQGNALKLVSERQQQTAKELAGFAAAPPPSAPSVRSSAPTSATKSLLSRGPSIKGSASQLEEVRTLRRDLAVLRQVYQSFVSDVNANMTTIRSKAASVKKAAAVAPIADLDSSTGRAYLNKGKKQLSEDSEKIVNRVDDLQDMVEDLRKDVVTRGVRPLPRQLETVSKDISVATSELKKLQEFLKREKPVWTKIWEKELQVVCDDRDLLTMQEELAADLEDDLEKAAATFALVEQATKQQNLQGPTGPNGAAPGSASRSTSRNLNPLALDHSADPSQAREGVLGEVRALQPNHESRLEAIERAERARQKELESRKGGEFQRELGNFVEEGKLKKSGGVEEVERMRKIREEKARKEMFERQQAKAREVAEREAQAAQQQQQEVNGAPTTDAPSLSGPGSVSQSSLEVPSLGGGGGGKDGLPERDMSSPDPPFVEAREEATTPVMQSVAS